MNEKNLIYSKIINVSRKVKPISKDNVNTQQNFKFRGIDDVFNALQPLMSEEGIFVTSKVVHSEREERKTGNGKNLLYSIIDIEFSFYAEDGSFVSCITKGEAMDMGDKASNKAMSTALKYALLQMFMIPTEESIDTDHVSHEVEPKQEEIKKIKGNFEDAVKKINESTLKSFGITMNDLKNLCEWTPEEEDKLRMTAEDKKKALQEEFKNGFTN